MTRVRLPSVKQTASGGGRREPCVGPEKGGMGGVEGVYVCIQ